MESVERLIVALGGIVADSEHARRARVVDVEGEPTLWVLPSWAHGRECRDAMLAKLVLELGERRGGVGTVRRQIAGLLRATVPALASGFGAFKLLHICPWDGMTSALEALLTLPNFLRW